MSLDTGGNKYDGINGLLTVNMLQSLDLPLDAKQQLVRAANQSLSTNSHCTYAAGVTSYTKMCVQRGIVPEFPLPPKHQLLWQAAMSASNLAAPTMRVYWSGVSRVCELVSGEKLVRHQIAEMAIKGAKNVVPKREKLAMSWTILRELKKQLDRQPKAKMTEQVKKMLWATCVVAMTGSFRLNELLPTKSKAGKLAGGLLRKNLRRSACRVEGKTRYFYLARLLQPKERAGAGASVDVELFANGGDFCPVRNTDIYLAERTEEEAGLGWVFTFPDGRPLTKLGFNKILRKLLKNVTGYKKVQGHSFRRGVPSLMAKAGYSDAEIQRQGRWKSQSWELYTVAGRAGRLEQQHALHTRLAQLAEEEVQDSGNLCVFDGEMPGQQ